MIKNKFCVWLSKIYSRKISNRKEPLLSRECFIARYELQEGDIVTRIWKNYVRRATAYDSKYLGISTKNCKKGERVEIIFSN